MKKYIIFVLSCLITSHLSLHIHADDTDSNSYQTSETGWKIEEKPDSYTLSCPLEYVDNNVFDTDSFEIQKDKNPNDIQRFINHIEAFNEYRSEFLQRQISQDQSLILPLTATAYALSQLNIFDAIYFSSAIPSTMEINYWLMEWMLQEEMGLEATYADLYEDKV